MPTINGSFTPNNPLSIFDGESTLGIWQLRLIDAVTPDGGTLNTWGIDYDYEIDAPVLDVTLDVNGNATVNAEDLLYSIAVDCGSYSALAGNPLAPTITFTCADIGTNTVAVEVTNDSGAASTCSAIVNVIGNGGGGGTLTCPGDIIQSNDAGLCGAIVTYTVNSPAGCSGGTLSQTAGLASGSTFPVGTTTNTFEYDDGINPIQTCSFDVTINDTEDPTAICQNITVELDATGNVSITAADINNGSTDNCAVDTVSISTDSFTCAEVGANNVTLTVTDVNGNTSTCVAVVTVEDNLAPVLVCPADQTQQTGAGDVYILPDYWAIGEVTATDNCTDPLPITTQDPAQGTGLPEGVYTITFTAEDEYGNIGTCTFELTVDRIAGIGDQNAGIESIAMYPNPTQGILMIANPKQLLLDDMKIFDLRGRLIKTVDLQNMGLEKSIDVSDMASSTYLILIQGKNGQITKRLVKE